MSAPTIADTHASASAAAESAVAQWMARHAGPEVQLVRTQGGQRYWSVLPDGNTLVAAARDLALIVPS